MAAQKNFQLSQQEVDCIQRAVELFHEKEQNGFETRYKSWQHCHKYFSILRGKTYNTLNPDEKELALLHLSAYLASWGMYRGSSFILQYDKSIFDGVLKVVFDKKNYGIFWDVDYNTIKTSKADVKSALVGIRDALNNTLSPYRNFSINKYKKELTAPIVNKNVNQTLITKILLGTLCCCPAYDTYFKAAIGTRFDNFYVDDKIDNLLELVIQNDVFDSLSKQCGYPLMKIVDMAYFTIGIEKDFEKHYKNYIAGGNPIPQGKWSDVVKSIKTVYYKLNKNSAQDIHVSFNCDKKIVDDFIENNKTEIDKVLNREVKNEQDE